MNERTPSLLDSFLLRIGPARVAILFAFHALVFAACYVFAYLVRFEFTIPVEFMQTFKWSLPVVVGTQLLIGIVFGFYRGWWRYVGLADVVRLVTGLSTSLVLLLSLWYAGGIFGVDARFDKSPRGVLLVDWAFALLFLFGIRVLIRLGRDRLRPMDSGAAAPKRVLIIGAGDGGVLRRVLQHPSVQAAVMVEIDGEVVRLSKEHLPGIGRDAWTDPRATVIVGDGIQYVADSPDDSFDVVIVDSTDPVGVGEALFTDTFYAGCARVLGPGGIIVNQCGVPFMQAGELQETSRRLAKVFPHVSAYLAAVPTYAGGFMALGFAAHAPGLDRLPVPTIRDRAAAAGILGTTQYWTPELHVGAFHLPPYIAQCLPRS